MTGKIIETRKFKPGELPGDFEYPITINLQDKDWQVVKAEPGSANEFTLSKKLTLYLRQGEWINPRDIRFSIPTASTELPEMSDTSLFRDFILELQEDDWRQIEFFRLARLPEIQMEMEAVENILFPEDGSSTFPGYDKIHVRALPREQLHLDIGDFCKLANVQEKGALTISGNPGFIKNGFALRSLNYTYYGTIEKGNIHELCLRQFDQADDEFARIAATYHLALVSWCKAEITTI